MLESKEQLEQRMDRKLAQLDAFLDRTDWTQIAQQTSHHICRTHTHTHQQRISIAIWPTNNGAALDVFVCVCGRRGKVP